MELTVKSSLTVRVLSTKLRSDYGWRAKVFSDSSKTTNCCNGVSLSPEILASGLKMTIDLTHSGVTEIYGSVIDFTSSPIM